jgi:hypothetical protein
MVKRQKTFQIKDIVLSLWGVVLAFLVQVLYDNFEQPFYTSKMPKVWWGLLISAVLFLLLLFYMRKLYIPKP